MAITIDEIKAMASSKLGFARSNQFLVTFPPLGRSGLAGLLAGAVGESVADQMSGFLPSIPGVPGLSGPSSTREINVLCTRASLPAKRILTSDRQIHMRNEKVAYGYVNDDVSFTFYLMNDYGILNYFQEWQKLVLNEDTQTVGYKNDYAKPIQIHQLRKPIIGKALGAGPIRVNLGLGGGTVYSVELLEAFPVQVSEIVFSNELDGLLEVTVDIAYTRFKRAGEGQGFINLGVSPGQIF